MMGFSVAFHFLVGRSYAMKIAEFPGQVLMSPEMVENLLEPVLTCTFLGSNLAFFPRDRCNLVGSAGLIDVILLDLDSVVAESVL